MVQSFSRNWLPLNFSSNRSSFIYKKETVHCCVQKCKLVDPILNQVNFYSAFTLGFFSCMCTKVFLLFCFTVEA